MLENNVPKLGKREFLKASLYAILALPPGLSLSGCLPGDSVSGVVPKAIDIEAAVYSNGQNFAIFRLSKEASLRLATGGVAALSDDITPRNPKVRHGLRYLGWYEAPMLEKMPHRLVHMTSPVAEHLGKYANGSAMRLFLAPPKMNNEQKGEFDKLLKSAYEKSGFFAVNVTNEVLVFVDTRHSLCAVVIGEN